MEIKVPPNRQIIPSPTSSLDIIHPDHHHPHVKSLPDIRFLSFQTPPWS
jgi:hypothetical protein